MRVDNSTGKGTSGTDMFSSKVHRVHMELGGKLRNSLRIETQFFERLQSVGVVDGAAHTQKDDVESNGCSLENVADIFVVTIHILSKCLGRYLIQRRKISLCCAVPLRRPAGSEVK